MKKTKKLTQKMVRKLFTYKRNGELWWNERDHGRRLFKPAGGVQSHGVVIRLQGVQYLRARLVYLHQRGVMPDHIWRVDGDVFNDRIGNLRDNHRFLKRCVDAESWGSTGLKYIQDWESKGYQYWRFKVMDNGKMLIQKAFSKNLYSLDEAVAFRNRWLKKNAPERWAHLRANFSR